MEMLITIREMLADGFTVDRIAKYIKMPVDWIESRLEMKESC